MGLTLTPDDFARYRAASMSAPAKPPLALPGVKRTPIAAFTLNTNYIRQGGDEALQMALDNLSAVYGAPGVDPYAIMVAATPTTVAGNPYYIGTLYYGDQAQGSWISEPKKDNFFEQFLDRVALPIGLTVAAAVITAGAAQGLGITSPPGDVGINQIGVNQMTPQQIEAAVQTPQGSFDPFNYTSGEAFPAATDAQEVSYGFNNSGDPIQPLQGAERSVDVYQFYDQNALPAQSLNSTPESLVSDYGTTSDPNFAQARLPGEDWTSGDTIRLSRPNPGIEGVTNGYGSLSGGGMLGPKSIYDGAMRVGETIVGAVKTAGAVVGAGAAVKQAISGQQGTQRELTTAQARTYTGQLDSGNTAPQNAPMTGGHFLLIAAAVGLAVWIFA